MVKNIKLWQMTVKEVYDKTRKTQNFRMPVANPYLKEALPLPMKIYAALCLFKCRYMQSFVIYSKFPFYRIWSLKSVGFDCNMLVDGLVPIGGSLISTQHQHTYISYKLHIKPLWFPSFSCENVMAGMIHGVAYSLDANQNSNVHMYL